MGYMCLFFSFGFLRVYAWEWDCWVIQWFYSSFLKESPCHLPWWLYQFTFSPTMQECSFFSTLSPAFIVCRHFDDGHSNWCKVISHCIFYLHFCNNEWCWASFMHLLAMCMSSLEKYLFRSFSHFLICCLFFWHWVVWAACIFWKLILCQLFHLLLFSPI